MKLKFAVFAFAVTLSAPANAQVGSTTDILMGRVAGLDSQAVANARVEATSTRALHDHPARIATP